MATRLESVFAEIVAEMGADANSQAYADYSHWGKRADEARKSTPWITWVEEDEGERVVPPQQDEAGHEIVCAQREIPVVITVCAADSTLSEDVFHALLAAISRALTERAYAWGDVEKGGDRPNSSEHKRAVRIVFRVPVLAEERLTHTILTTTTAIVATDQAGLNPEQGVP